MNTRLALAAACLVIAAAGILIWLFRTTVPDHTSASLEQLGIPPVVPAKDPKTGFIVGGQNPTALLRNLTEINGRTIAELEAEMRPGNRSETGSVAGFLGPDEALLDVLAMDNEFVADRHGLTHQELARHLHLVGAIALKHVPWGDSKEYEFRYHGRLMSVARQSWKGLQFSPFLDGTSTDTDVTVTNRTHGKQLKYSLLVPYMIERYGFYEGKGTPYRVEPRDVLEVFDFLTTTQP
jgi:hypothetical protein